jgi:hypothetical protein
VGKGKPASGAGSYTKLPSVKTVTPRRPAMLRTLSLRLAVIVLASMPFSAAASTARADEHKGTVIHIKNSTDKAMTFFVELKTPDGSVRNFVGGVYLRSGESASFTLEGQYEVASRRDSGVTKYLVRVRAFRGQLESTKFAAIADDRPEYWWGGSSQGITGLKCEDYDREGYTHLFATLVW